MCDIFALEKIICCLVIILQKSYCDLQYKKEVDLIFSNVKDIRRFTFGLSNYSAIVGGLKEVRALDYDYASDLLFYILVHDQEEYFIKKTSISKPGVSTDVVKGLKLINSFEGISIDWVTKKVYFTDTNTNRVEVCQYDGLLRRVLVSEKLDHPVGIALLPQEGFMFVAESGDSPKIVRFRMDGSHPKVLVELTSVIQIPYSIAVDTATHLVYWGDTHYNKIEYMTTSGKSRSYIKLDSDKQPYYIAAFSGKVFWTNRYSKIFSWSFNQTIHEISSFSGSSISPYGIAVYSLDKQGKVNTSCLNNGHCSQLCLLSKDISVCQCPTGVPLKNDKKSCSEIKKFLLVGRKIDLRIVSLDVEEIVDIVLPIKDMHHANGIDYDVLEQKVYWADSYTNSINRAFLNGTGHEQVAKTDIVEPAHLAIDWVARNLYWTDASLNRIEVSRLDGSSRKIIVSENLIQLRGIAIDPVGGHIYWSVWGNYTRIECADLDGDNRNIIVSEDLLLVNGMAFYNNFLYWAAKEEIGMYDTIKKQRVQFLAGISDPFAISLLGSNLYWTNFNREVTRYNFATKQRDKLLSGELLADVMGIKAVDTQFITGYNPCHYQYSKCSHLCFFNVIKNASVCACPEEMELSLDGITCNVPNGFLLYSGSIEGLKKLSIDTNRASKLSLPNSRSARLLEIYSNESRVFWLEETDPSTINSACLNGSGFKTVVSGGLKDVNGLAIDWMARNIYWINGRIEVARLNGLFRKVLIYGEDILEPTLIVINPLTSQMYWFQRSLNGSDQYSLWQANLDGSSRYLLMKGIHPTSCSIDYKTNNIYWVHQNLQDSSIEFYDFKTSKRVLVYSGLPPTHALLVFQDSLIVGSHGDSTSIKMLSMMGKGQVIDLIKDTPFIHDIKIIHNGIQLGSNLCSRNNGGCEHLCFALSTTARLCSCATHYTLNEDGRSCFQPELFLIFSYEFSFARVVFQDSVPESVLPIHTQVKSSAIAFDEVRSFLYWLDSGTTSVSRVHQNGSGYENIKLFYSHSSILSDPYDFALDQFSNSIYWTDKYDNTIKFINLCTKKNGTILQETSYFPRKITVFPEHGSLFWINEDINSPKYGIMLTKISGVYSTTLLKIRKFSVVDMAIDFIGHRLFWLDTDSIHSVSLSGKDFIDNIVQNIHTPVALAVFGQYLYYADSSKSFIYKVSKENITSQTYPFHGKYEHLSSLVVVNLTRGKDSHPCSINNGGCSDICTINYQIDHSPLKSLPMPLCACPLFQSLADSNICNVHEHCNSDEFFCKSDSLCINMSKKCDYKEDCTNGEDEICSYHYQPCNTGFIACGNKGCIDVSSRCDGKINCPHGEDEYNCVDLCGENQFHCKYDHRRCFNEFQMCDGFDDCFDASDESNCQKKNNLTNLRQPTHQTKENSIVAGIISGVVVCIILLVFGLFFFIRIRHSKKNASRELEMSMWPLNQLNSEIGSLTGESNYTKSSISTYISTMSKNTDKSFYDRNNVTGASSVVSDYSHIPLNPPPSPTTDRGFSVISDAPTTYDYTSCDQCSCQTGEEYDAPPPTLASMDELDMYCPINKHAQANWSHLDSVSNNSHHVHNNSNKRVRSRNRSMRNNTSNKINGSHISAKGVSNVDSLQRQWLCKEESDLDSSYEREGIYGDVNNRLLIFDPPPTPCTNYMSEEDRPPSDTETSVIEYGNTIRTHFAPPPSPVSYLLQP